MENRPGLRTSILAVVASFMIGLASFVEHNERPHDEPLWIAWSVITIRRPFLYLFGARIFKRFFAELTLHGDLKAKLIRAKCVLLDHGDCNDSLCHCDCHG